MTSGLLSTNKNDLWDAIFTALVSGIKICPLGHSPESCSMATRQPKLNVRFLALQPKQ